MKPFALLIVILCLSGSTALPEFARAGAPAGRAWSPVTLFDSPGMNPFVYGYPLLLRDGPGRPAVLVAMRRGDGPVREWSVLAWQDSAWVDSVVSSEPMDFVPRLAVTTDGSRELLSISRVPDPNGYHRMVIWGVGQSFAAPETVAVTTSQYGAFAYSAAVTAGRRWLSRVDQPPGQLSSVKTYFSDSPGSWQAVAPLGSDLFNCAIAPLADSTALLVYSGFGGTFWTLLNGSQWAAVQPYPNYVYGMTFVPRAEGGWWLLNSDRAQVLIDVWNGSGWDTEATLEALREPPGRGFVHVGWLEPSQESGAPPAVAWQENWSEGIVWHSAAHVAWPEAGGWSPGYQVPESDSMFIGPSVALDRNGDAWVSWRCEAGYNRWTHTYVSVTAGTPQLLVESGARRVDWELSGSAPGSWWAVLRDAGSGQFQEVARVQAGAGTLVSWLDDSPLTGTLRYRIRRESVDARYSWTSDPAEIQVLAVGAPIGAGSFRLHAHPNPVSARSTLEVRGARPGPVEIGIHDLSGRAIATLNATAGPSGSVDVPFELGAGAFGIYFARARDTAGRSAAPLRLVRISR